MILRVCNAVPNLSNVTRLLLLEIWQWCQDDLAFAGLVYNSDSDKEVPIRRGDTGIRINEYLGGE